jgi:hypothetical protein
VKSSLSLRTRVIFHSANAFVAVSGLIYALAKWVLEKPASEYGTPIHPLEPVWKSFHILSAPLLVYALGWIWHAHVQGQIRRGGARKRRSGLGLVALASPMVLSGSAFQLAVDEPWRTFWSQLHLWSGVLWVLASVGHLKRPGPRQTSVAPSLRGSP